MILELCAESIREQNGTLWYGVAEYIKALIATLEVNLIFCWIQNFHAQPLMKTPSFQQLIRWYSYTYTAVTLHYGEAVKLKELRVLSRHGWFFHYMWTLKQEFTDQLAGRNQNLDFLYILSIHYFVNFHTLVKYLLSPETFLCIIITTWML